MSGEILHKQEFHLRTLPTRRVVLYPRRAEVTRDIGNILLEPGSNEITVYGLTPTTDKDSIKVDGYGTATITDMAVDLVPNPDHFEDVYLSDAASDSESSDHDGADDEVEDQVVTNLKALITDLSRQRDAQQEVLDAELSSLHLLENLLNKLDNSNVENLSDGIDMYGKKRQSLFESRQTAAVEKDRIAEDIAKKEKELAKVQARSQRLKAKEARRKLRDGAKKRKETAQRLEAKQRTKKDRVDFWPRLVYRVVVTLDVGGLTPSSSRRGSFDSLAKTASTATMRDSEPNDAELTATLCLSYITSSASWSPRYDLSINTPNSSGTIIYRAELLNSTSETWKDAKVVLSTSQTSFSGLGDPIPTIKPWTLRLQKDRETGMATYSQQELEFSRKKFDNDSNDIPNSLPRASLFGISGPQLAAAAPLPQAAPAGNAAQQDYQMQLLLLEQQNKKRLQMARQEQDDVRKPTGAGFGQSMATKQQAQAQANLTAMRQQQQQQAQMQHQFQVQQVQPPGQANQMMFSSMDTADVLEQFDFDAFLEGDAELPMPKPLAHVESTWEESGLTATYELPGTRTIAPSFTPRRFKIATVALSSIALTHILVPKLRLAAFLRARITNTSPIALLKGTAGLTLDGSFLGNTTMPRCSAGETFPLQLGIDPALSVSYASPSVRKNIASGMFNKEDSVAYTRSITLTNTRTNGSPIDVTVRDQVPVSEDEKLNVEIEQPKGLRVEGDTARTGSEFFSAQTQKVGAAATASGAARGVAVQARGSEKNDKWGHATAKMTKNGNIEWIVRLNPGKGARLVLEYELRFPSGEQPKQS